MTYDVAVVGGGPVGLALSIVAAQGGLSIVLLERHAMPVDKACGEGVLPGGLRALEQLGVRALLSPADCSPIRGIRYIQEDGTHLEGRLPDIGGLGVRRSALSAALMQRARECGVQLRPKCAVSAARYSDSAVDLETAEGRIDARMLVAADGLASPMRIHHGLDRPVRGPPRFGVRQHFKLAPWTDMVEVHFGVGREAYVTPVGTDRVGVAFLWRKARPEKSSFQQLLESFPLLQERLGSAVPDSAVRGAGPLARRASCTVLPRFALVGDAAGYLDAITGEGLALGLSSAIVLGDLLPQALQAGATREALRPYEQAYRREFRRYFWTTRAVLAMADHPRLRRALLGQLSRRPALFQSLLGLALKPAPRPGS